jgi:hypothetical protein
MSKMKSVKSSNIAEVGYNDGKQILLIRFTSNKLYAYFDVPANVVSDFVNASSLGSFFGGNIKNDYVTQQIEDSELAIYLGKPRERKVINYPAAMMAAADIAKHFRGAAAFF